MMEASWRYLALFVLMAMVNDVVGVSISLCSSANTADGSATYSEYQSDGLCSTTCGSNYAFAITQGSNCWCSNYAPEETVSTSSCSEKCPGYPYEYCGSTSGLFSYVALSKKPSGTIAGSSASAESTSQASSSDSSSSMVTSTPDSTSTPSTSSDAGTETVTRSAVTSIITLPGQTQVSTIVITPSSAATGDSSPLGQGASNSLSSKGLSKGAVAGLAVGVALGISFIAGIIIFFLWRRMKQHREISEAGLSPEMAIGGLGGTPSSVSRHTSTMSQSGLLNKNPRISTRNLSNAWGSSGGHSAASTASPTGTGNRRSIGADQRLDPYHAIYTNEDLRHSDVSLQDNTDYSRKILSVRNRGEGEIDDD